MKKSDYNFLPMPRYQMRRNALENILVRNNCEGKNLLEIGYGAGEIFSLYKDFSMRVTGYDFSEIAYQYAMQHYIWDEIELVKYKHDIKTKSYDFVVACEVLEHIEKDVEALKEWVSFLKPEGKLIISVPAHQKRWGASDIYVGHYKRYERAELMEKISEVGYRIETIYTYDFPSCLILDKLRDISCAKKLKRDRKDKDKEEHTKESGVKREFNPLVRKLSHGLLWTPVIKFQQLFYNTDLGSAYILIASKNTI